MDKKALKILTSTYWSSSGWKPGDVPLTPPDDFLYAKRAGVMFDPARFSHQNIVERVFEVLAKVNSDAITKAFLASLSTRRLDLRSALGSYAVLRHFPVHEFRNKRKACPTCGEYDRPSEDEDLNVLNFERYKWGGVRHEEPIFGAFDLERFLETEGLVATIEDLVIFRNLIRAIASVSPETTAPQLQAKLSDILPSNKAEREVLINILGYTGILRTPGHPSFRESFIPYSDRDLPPHRFVDMGYPACWWRGRDGIDYEALRSYFPTIEF